MKFRYTNHRGETADREIIVESLDYLRAPGFDYEPGWFITGFDGEKNVRRSFSLDRIKLDNPGVVLGFTIQLREVP